jgi:hypothetical protein
MAKNRRKGQNKNTGPCPGCVQALEFPQGIALARCPPAVLDQLKNRPSRPYAGETNSKATVLGRYFWSLPSAFACRCTYVAMW